MSNASVANPDDGMTLMQVIVRRLVLVTGLLCLVACAGVTSPPHDDRPAPVPIPMLAYRQAAVPGTLLVFLPGIAGKPGDLLEHGWIAALQARFPEVDAWEVDAHYAYYRERSIVQRLHDDVVARARAEGYRHIWLVGMSLGGFGALLYERECPGDVDGIILLSPYLGPPDAVKAMQRDGLEDWRPRDGDDFDQFWQWLQHLDVAQRDRIWLVYGRYDPFWRQHAQLTQWLPPVHVHGITGFHEWWTGGRLWGWVLQQAPWQAGVEVPAR